MITKRVETVKQDSEMHKCKFLLVTSVNFILRALFNKGTNNGFKSQTYKILRLVLMTLGFVIMSYYKAMMNAALNVDVNNIPIESWEDLANSHYKILLTRETIQEDRFKYGDELKQMIHKEKIVSVDPEKQLQNVGVKGSVPALLSGNYLALATSLLYIALEEYPCQIIDIKSSTLR